MLFERICLAVAAGCLVASASVATPIVPVSQARSVTASTTHPLGTPSSNTVSAPSFAPFVGNAGASSGPPGDLATAFARQTSSIGSERIELLVDGMAFLTTFGGSGSEASSFDITFDVLEQSNYTLFYEGRLNQFVTTSGKLSDSQGVLINLIPDFYTGVLAPGRYRLEAYASGQAAFSEFDGRIHQRISMTLAPIPEPSTALLLASGFLLLAAGRRAARRS